MRRVHTCAVLMVGGAFAGASVVPLAEAASTGRSDPQPGRIVSEEPARNTPNILDGTVTSIAQVGDQVVVGGTFTQARNPGSSTTLTRNHALSFDATTGVISETFVPHPNGTVYVVAPAADGTSVYLGGRFTEAAGRAVSNLVKVDVATSGAVTEFRSPSLDGDVRDLEVVGERLWVAGKFRRVGATAQRALATLDATTGAFDEYFTGAFAGLHNPALSGSVTDVLHIATDPANTRLVAVGNFTSVNRRSRSQIAMFDISGPSYRLSDWSTTLFTSPCSPKFDTYMTDVQFSPNGRYFVVSTTGASGGRASLTGDSGCDVVARFENRATGVNRATWTAYTGGDTTWSVEVTDDVVYAGGHQRWQNNPGGRDTAAQGAVERTGIAALNPVNGMAYSWNPTRARGVGVRDMLATGEGLYVGSDTTLIGRTPGNRYHARIALMPLAEGKTLPPRAFYPLPAQVYTVAPGASQLVLRGFDGTGVTTTATVSTAENSPAWGRVVGGFMVNGTLYTATRGGVLTRRSFDGTGYGTPSVVATADALVFQTGWHVYDVPELTSLFYNNGRIYFTRAGQDTLFYRGFEVEDGIVGQQRLRARRASRIPYSSIRGAFVAGGKLYYATTTGRLFRSGWWGSGPSAGPVAGTVVQVSGPGKDAENWASRAMFLRHDGPEPVG